ncbi:MAG TPA: cellulase, partial [Spirochaetia bacterium]|nr:cellulase [Spirochaetia bacterium]
MTRIYLFLVLAAVLSAAACEEPEVINGEPEIRVNQIGFYPEAVKQVITVNLPEDEFSVRDVQSKTEVFRGKLVRAGTWDGTDEKSIRVGDFSGLTAPGTYVIQVSGAEVSYPFTIGADVYHDVFHAAIKSYYFQRASVAIPEEYGGVWARKAGHPDTDLVLQEETGRTGRWSSPGGWYDAGDYGKYVVNAGITVWTLQALAELYPDAVGDNLDIPESGNGRSDLLDEIKYELDWLITMQDEDGGVFFKVAPIRGWPGFVLPEDDLAQRYVIGKSTTSTLNFALAAAQGARVFQAVLPDYAADLKERAVRAFAWAEQHPTAAEPVEAEGSGSYGDTEYGDEFFAAAAELYITTGDPHYFSRIEATLKTPHITGPAGWQNVNNLGYFSLAALPSALPAALREAVTREIVRYADALVDQINANPYRIPMTAEDFIWGSNSVLLNEVLTLGFAFRITDDTRYLAAIDMSVDYIFGKNAVGYSFVTGYGSKTPMRPHHRPSRAGSARDPVPGLLAGGPNRNQEDGLMYGTE